MTTQHTTRRCLGVLLLCSAWFCCHWSGYAQGIFGTTNNATLNLARLSAAFTVTDIQVTNGMGEAVGILTVDATPAGGSGVNLSTNLLIHVPVPLDGALAGKAAVLGSLDSTPVQPPSLSTNLCIILAISIDFVDVTVPGLGLNVHVNQLLLGVRADKDTRLGSVLCTILGEDVGAPKIASALSGLRIRLQGNQIVIEGGPPGILQSTAALRNPGSWTNIPGPRSQTLTSTGAVQVLVAPTNAAQFFRLLPQ